MVLCGRSEEKMRLLLQEIGDSCVYHACFDITDDSKRHEFCEDVKEKVKYTVLKILNEKYGITDRRGDAELDAVWAEKLAAYQKERNGEPQ